jgi:hypothetical protein
LHLHPRVDLPNGSCTRVPEGGDGGADGDVHHVVVEQDLDQVQKGQGQPCHRRQAPDH